MALPLLPPLACRGLEGGGGTAPWWERTQTQGTRPSTLAVSLRGSKLDLRNHQVDEEDRREEQVEPEQRHRRAVEPVASAERCERKSRSCELWVSGSERARKMLRAGRWPRGREIEIGRRALVDFVNVEVAVEGPQPKPNGAAPVLFAEGEGWHERGEGDAEADDETEEEDDDG